MRKVLALAVAGMVAFASGSALAEGDAAKGEKVFKNVNLATPSRKAENIK